MAINNNVTLIGNIMEPEVRQTQTGKTLAKARMVVKTPGEGDDMWVNVTAWEKLGENLAQSFNGYSGKTMRVMVVGRLVEDKWEDKNTGQERKAMSITADTISVTLDWQYVNGVTNNGKFDSESSYGGDNVGMAKDILGATEKPVARTNYEEHEAPF
jgi:single stranded DNA-binding protein